MFLILSIFVLTTQSSFLTRKTTSMALRFWHQAKPHMRKFNSAPKESLIYFLKEPEWRFNNPDPQAQLKILRQWVLDSLN